MQALILLWIKTLQNIGGLRGDPHVVLYHFVGEKIVGGNAAVFVGAFAEQKILSAGIGVFGVAARPETGCLNQGLRSSPQEKVQILCAVHILSQSVGHIGGHMNLTAADIPGLALLAAIQGHHPGVAGSVPFILAAWALA